MKRLRGDETVALARTGLTPVDGNIVELHALRFHNPTARITLRGARAAYVGPGLNLEPHRNAVATVALALHQPFDLAVASRAGQLGVYEQHRAWLIPPGTWHHLRAHGPMAFVYFDALSDDVEALSSKPMHRLTEQDVIELVSPAHGDAIALLSRILGSQPAFTPAPDARVAALVREINQAPEAITSITQAAAIAGLSPSRCQHLLRVALGVPFRRYRLWRRMALVMRRLAEGASLTEAAHASGFSSSAHLSTAFKAMFGLAPSAFHALGVTFDLD
jgi:AraC-like DNA-binding protein